MNEHLNELWSLIDTLTIKDMETCVLNYFKSGKTASEIINICEINLALYEKIRKTLVNRLKDEVDKRSKETIKGLRNLVIYPMNDGQAERLLSFMDKKILSVTLHPKWDEIIKIKPSCENIEMIDTKDLPLSLIKCINGFETLGKFNTWTLRTIAKRCSLNEEEISLLDKHLEKYRFFNY